MSPPYDNHSNGWSEWKNHVLLTLERIETAQDELRKDVAELKTKAAIWGGIASFVITTLVNLAIGAMK